MTVTFIHHSCFLVELDAFYCLFDYFEGVLPPLDSAKPLFVFASHGHEDHFSPAVFALHKTHPDTRFILARSIRITPRRIEEWGLSPAQVSAVTSVRSDEMYTFSVAGDTLTVQTLKSTDIGVAFVLRWQERVIYHAGDLNWWHWAEESKAWNNNMAALFKRALEPLRGVTIDAAFAPLDPRQGADAYLGLDYLLRTAHVARAFPMHCWGHFECITQFKQGAWCQYDTEIMDVAADGQRWQLS